MLHGKLTKLNKELRLMERDSTQFQQFGFRADKSEIFVTKKLEQKLPLDMLNTLH